MTVAHNELQIWSPQAAAAGTGPAHTWLIGHPSTEAVVRLGATVLAAGWQWHRADSGHLRKLVTCALERLHALKEDPTVTPGERIFVFAGLDVDELNDDLRLLVRIGRGVGIHLGVADELNAPGRADGEFRDSITGYWRYG